MPTNVGDQTVSIIYHNIANSSVVNKRHKGIRKTGIYAGGYITLVPPLNVSISPLICEVTDGTHQVRIQTAEAVNIAVASGTPYVVLRWVYAGAVSDYMQILAVATPATNDLVVGLCSFTGGGILQGKSYSERSNPNVYDLFLKVEPTEDVELRVRIRGGRIQTNSGVIDISDQLSDYFTPPSSPNSKVYLVYLNATTGAVTIDSSGTPAVSPVAPSYNGKLVLAEVTLAYDDTDVTADKIKDVRDFITSPTLPDDIMIEKDADGKLTTKRCFRDYILIRDIKAAGVDGGTFTSGAWRTRDLIEESSDVGGHAGLGANRITLVAGTYEFEVSAPAYLVGSHQVRLYNISDASIVTSGSVMYNAGACVTRSEACGRFTITSPKVFEVQHRCSITQASTGFGKACNFGSWEQYTVARFWKVA